MFFIFKVKNAERSSKLATIKLVKGLIYAGLKDAKDMMDGAPAPIKRCIQRKVEPLKAANWC